MDNLAVLKRVPRALLVKREDLADNNDPERLAMLPKSVAERLHMRYTNALNFLYT